MPSTSSKEATGISDIITKHYFPLPHFPKPWKGTQVITLTKTYKDPKFPKNLGPTCLLSATGRLFEKVILKVVQRHIGERGLLNASQFAFRAHRITTLQCEAYGPHKAIMYLQLLYSWT
jgi:hypothetical protein